MPSMVLKKGSGAEEVSEVFKLYDEIAKVLQKDADIRKMLDNVLTEDCYPDKNLRTAVVDLAYLLVGIITRNRKCCQNQERRCKLGFIPLEKEPVNGMRV